MVYFCLFFEGLRLSIVDIKLHFLWLQAFVISSSFFPLSCTKRVKTRLVFQVMVYNLHFSLRKKSVFFSHFLMSKKRPHCCCQVAPNSWEWAWPAAPNVSSSRALGVNVQLCPKNGLNCGWCLAIRKVFFCQNFKKKYCWYGCFQK